MMIFYYTNRVPLIFIGSTLNLRSLPLRKDGTYEYLWEYQYGNLQYMRERILINKLNGKRIFLNKWWVHNYSSIFAINVQRTFESSSLMGKDLMQYNSVNSIIVQSQSIPPPTILFYFLFNDIASALSIHCESAIFGAFDSNCALVIAIKREKWIRSVLVLLLLLLQAATFRREIFFKRISLQ